MSTNVTLAERLAEIRTKRKLTQTELAEKIGISRISLGNYESGKRHPDSQVIQLLCKKLNVSADYLLGITDTENQAYAEIAETTGLDEMSIKYLRNTTFPYRELVNLLLREERVEYDHDIPTQSTKKDCLDYEKAYQNHLKYLAWEKNTDKMPILEHISNDWAFADYSNNLSIEKIEAQTKNEYSDSLLGKVISNEFSIPTYEECLEQSKRLEAYWEHEELEKRKSNLLSAIFEYVNYQNGCQIDTIQKSESLTEEHSIYIGIGNGRTVKFPSKESDELFEFMLVQKVIDALKKFKTNASQE